jgi:uncharacterized membrane protein
MADIMPRRARFVIVDWARGAALVAMAIYHLCWDLSFFRFLDVDVAGSPGGRASSTAIAGSFLTLVGISLVLAHGSGVRWQPFLKRLAVLVVAAAGVTLATSVAMPDGMIYFGILHCIAVSCLIGLIFLRAPWPLTAAVALACFTAPHIFRSEIFNGFGWLWLGLATVVPRTNDYEPLLPWLGFVLAGIALVRAVPPARWPVLSGSGRAGKPLAFLGRHSLTFYLIHQPILFGTVWLAAQIMPVPAQPAAANALFDRQCVAVCRQSGEDAPTCANYCNCVSGAARADGIWDALIGNRLDQGGRQKLDKAIEVCSR